MAITVGDEISKEIRRQAMERQQKAGELYGRGGKLQKKFTEAIHTQSRDQLGEMFGVWRSPLVRKGNRLTLFGTDNRTRRG